MAKEYLNQIPDDYTVQVTNKFKGLDLVDKVPEELMSRRQWPKLSQEKEMQEGKVVEEILQIAEERREAKGNREKGRYIQLNAEFQRITRRDKKAFFNKQCKEIEENNRMGKTGDLFKKTGDIKGTFHVKMVKMK